MRGLLTVFGLFLLISFISGRAIAAPHQPIETLEQYFSRLAIAIDRTESGNHPYGILAYLRGRDEDSARKVCLATIMGRYRVWKEKQQGMDFIFSLSLVYCPVEDGHEGNRNWRKNVRYFMATSRLRE